MKFKVTLPNNNCWFALSFGQGMNNVDMVKFTHDSVVDLWSTGYFTPTIDTMQSYRNIKYSRSGTKYIIEAERDRITTDTSRDFKFDDCSKTHAFKWAANTGTSSFSKHNRKGDFTLVLDSKCEVDNTTTNTNTNTGGGGGGDTTTTDDNKTTDGGGGDNKTTDGGTKDGGGTKDNKNTTTTFNGTLDDNTLKNIFDPAVATNFAGGSVSILALVYSTLF